MSSPQANAVERFVELARTSPVAQAGIVSVCCVAGVSAWLLAPYIKLAASAAKGEALALFYGTPEQRLLDHVKKTAKQGDPQSVLDVIDDFCWKHQWMMNIGNIKGKILDQAVNEAQPSVRRRERTRREEDKAARGGEEEEKSLGFEFTVFRPSHLGFSLN